MAADIIAVPLRYTQCDWGDCIEGSKDQLQALGIGLGRAYPGELGASRLEMTVRDPRGRAVKISRAYTADGRYSAHIRFPGWPPCPDEQKSVQAFPGVRRIGEYAWGDIYVGSAEALISAGLVLLHQLPGAPGTKRTSVKILTDGTIDSRAGKREWAKRVTRVGTNRYEVWVHVSKETSAQRDAARDQALVRWRQEIQALPRPPKLEPLSCTRLGEFREACLDATRDQSFQFFLSRLVQQANAKGAR